MDISIDRIDREIVDIYRLNDGLGGEEGYIP